MKIVVYIFFMPFAYFVQAIVLMITFSASNLLPANTSPYSDSLP